MGVSKTLIGGFCAAKEYAIEVTNSTGIYTQVYKNLKVNNYQPGQDVWLKDRVLRQ